MYLITMLQKKHTRVYLKTKSKALKNKMSIINLAKMKAILESVGAVRRGLNKDTFLRN